jgi:hypothetical protein
VLRREDGWLRTWHDDAVPTEAGLRNVSHDLPLHLRRTDAHRTAPADYDGVALDAPTLDARKGCEADYTKGLVVREVHKFTYPRLVISSCSCRAATRISPVQIRRMQHGVCDLYDFLKLRRSCQWKIGRSYGALEFRYYTKLRAALAIASCTGLIRAATLQLQFGLIAE